MLLYQSDRAVDTWTLTVQIFHGQGKKFELLLTRLHRVSHHRKMEAQLRTYLSQTLSEPDIPGSDACQERQLECLQAAIREFPPASPPTPMSEAEMMEAVTNLVPAML